MSTHPELQVSYESGTAEEWLGSGENVLAVFEFGLSPLASRDPRHVPVALEQLDGTGRLEVWRSKGPVHSGSWSELRFAQAANLTMGHIALDWKQMGMREASKQAYELFQAYLQQSPHPWPLKIWNYIPSINQGEGDDELYRQFCLGRADAVMVDPGDLPRLPAATGIGTPENEKALQVYFLSGALPGLDVENPRQVSAWRYPRQYGPRRPLFSRGTILKMNGSHQVLISGTASIVGHETHHENEVSNQLRESLRNVRSLLDEGRRLMGNHGERLDEQSLFKVYVRNPKDLPLIRASLDATIPEAASRMYVQGDICRANLLTEIDGIVSYMPATEAET